MPKEGAKTVFSELKKGIKQAFLVEKGQQILAKTFPDHELKAYELPKGIATDIFKKIIDPFKGKVLFVDFWAISCGPCVGGIKRMKATREKYVNNPNFDFVFVTDERGSPEDRYNKFVEEQALKNTFRLAKDDYNYLRQLFQFNGIPRYVLIDKEGNVLNNNFSMYQFDTELSHLFPDMLQN